MTTLGSECARSNTRVFLVGGGTTSSEASAPKAAAARSLASPLQALVRGEAVEKTTLILSSTGGDVGLRHGSRPRSASKRV